MRIAKINSYILILIFVLFPFWSIIVAQINYFLKVPLNILTSIKYLFVVFSIFLFLINIFVKKNIQIREESILLGIFVIYVFFHLVGSSSLFLKLDGFKFEFVFPFLALLIFNANNYNINYLDILIKIIFYQGIVTLLVAFLEFMDQELLELLYRKSLKDIPHIRWFSVQRLMSTTGNPINLGATLSIWITSFLYMIYRNKVILLKLLYPVVLLFTFFIVSLTLSRTSLIVFIFTVFLSIFLAIDGYVNKVFFISLVVFILGFLVSVFLKDINIDLVLTRFENLFDTNEYTSNARVINWNYAISNMNIMEYFWGKGIGTSNPKAEYVQNYNAFMIENGFVSTFINYGILGVLLYLFLIIKFYVLSFKIKENNKALGLFLIIFLTVFCLFNTSNDYNRNLPYMLYFWIFYVLSELEFLKIKKELF